MDVAEESAVGLQAERRLDLVGGIASLVSPSSNQTLIEELIHCVGGDRTVPLRMQNQHSTVNTIQLSSDEQGSISTYWAIFDTSIFPPL